MMKHEVNLTANEAFSFDVPSLHVAYHNLDQTKPLVNWKTVEFH